MTKNLLTHVLPVESVLFKIEHDMFVFYKQYEDFEEEKEYTSQGSSESFDDFINRTIEKLQTEEAERLQTLPDNYTKCLSDMHRYECIGNGWTVDIITDIFNQMAAQ